MARGHFVAVRALVCKRPIFGSQIVANACPAEITKAGPQDVWRVLAAPERFGEWTDARFVSCDPAGPDHEGSGHPP